MNYKHITWKGYILPQKAHNLRMLTKTKDQNTACSVCPRTTQKFPLFPNQFNSYETKINKPRCPQPLLTAHGPRVKVKIQLLPINSHSGRLMIEMHHKEKKNCYRKKKNWHKGTDSMASLRTQEQQVFKEHSPDRGQSPQEHPNTKQAASECSEPPSSTGRMDQRLTQGSTWNKTHRHLPSASHPSPQKTTAQRLQSQHEHPVKADSSQTVPPSCHPNSATPTANHRRPKTSVISLPVIS